MCYHHSQEKEIQHIKRRFPTIINWYNVERFEKGFHVNGFSKPWDPVIVLKEDKKVIDFFKWGLIPSWVKEEKDWRANTLNARNDDFFNKASYKSYWQNRCLMICTGFFEPRNPENGKASTIQKTESWYIKPAQDEFFTLGAVYSIWKGIPTFSIITTDASPLMAEIHNVAHRMPLILDTDDVRDAWLLPDLNKKEMNDLMQYHPDDKQLTAYRVMDGVMNGKIDTNVEQVLRPIAGMDD